MTITPDLLDENCSDISDWVDEDTDTAVSEVDPAGQFRFDTNLGAAGNAYARRKVVLASPPNQFTIEVKTYFDAIGTVANTDAPSIDWATATWIFVAKFGTDGLFIYKTGGATTEVGTDIVLHGGSAAWQTWRFEVDKSGGEASATVEVFLNNVSQGTVDCDYEVAGTDGRIIIHCPGYTTDNMVTHFDHIKFGTGLGEFPLAATNILIIGGNF